MLENCRMMDMNKDSLVDLNEFLEAFRLCQQFEGNGGLKVDHISSTENLFNCTTTEPEGPSEPQVDEYEFSEMKESLNVVGQLKKSPSIRSVVSVESLSQTGDPQNQNNTNNDET